MIIILYLKLDIDKSDDKSLQVHFEDYSTHGQSFVLLSSTTAVTAANMVGFSTEANLEGKVIKISPGRKSAKLLILIPCLVLPITYLHFDRKGVKIEEEVTQETTKQAKESRYEWQMYKWYEAMR